MLAVPPGPRGASWKICATSESVCAGVASGALVTGGFEITAGVDADHAGRPQRALRSGHFVTELLQRTDCRVVGIVVDQKTSQCRGCLTERAQVMPRPEAHGLHRRLRRKAEVD